jgi:hypothetical protein
MIGTLKNQVVMYDKDTVNQKLQTFCLQSVWKREQHDLEFTLLLFIRVRV